MASSGIQRFMRRFAEQRGATAVEYALMVALIALAIVGVVTTLGLSVSDLFSDPQLSDALQP